MRCHEGEKLAGEILSNLFHKDPVFVYLDSQDRPRRSVPELFQKWPYTVQDYSRRSLLHPGGILAALGALALESHIRDGAVLGSYVAGLWTGTLQQGLSRHISQPCHPERGTSVMPSQTMSQYHAPSWSWATCGQPIIFRVALQSDLSCVESFESKKRLLGH
jgi:hypothetical protein